MRSQSDHFGDAFFDRRENASRLPPNSKPFFGASDLIQLLIVLTAACVLTRWSPPPQALRAVRSFKV
jgi:hypothetical protein